MRVNHRTDSGLLNTIKRRDNLQSKLERCLQEGANQSFISTLEKEIEATNGLIFGKWSF